MHLITTHIRNVLESNGVFTEQPIVVAVSGGPDSMALLHCLYELSYTCLVAHVNYGLRGEESDGDENCVRDYCVKRNIFFEVLNISNDEWNLYDGSTQEVARKMRYTWFEQMRARHNASVVLTAHHANDQTETMLYQFIRGGAGKSVYGMPERTGFIIRPMLAVSKSHVLQYIEEEAIPWRQDSTNDTARYTRNRVRHELMPLVESLNPSIHEAIQQRSSWMHQEQALVDWAVRSFRDKHCFRDHDTEVISISSLIDSGFGEVILWKWLSEYGFTSHQVIHLFEYMCGESSTEAAWFNAGVYEVCVQDGSMACQKCAEPHSEAVQALPWSNERVTIDYCLASEVEFTLDAKRQYLDADLVSIPFTMRVWHEGDRFHPLGAKGQQKISDFLTHAKIPAWRRRRTSVLCVGDDIAAVLQYRISEKFKKTDVSKRCVRIQFL